MKKKDALEKLQKVGEVMPAADALSFFKTLAELRKEQLSTSREMLRIESATNVATLQLEKKYDLLHKVFDRVFDERKDAIGKHFEIIEKGLQQGDRELVLGGLKGLSDIVSSSPFGNLGELAQLMNAGSTIEI